ESAASTRRRSLVRAQYRPSSKLPPAKDWGPSPSGRGATRSYSPDGRFLNLCSTLAERAGYHVTSGGRRKWLDSRDIRDQLIPSRLLRAGAHKQQGQGHMLRRLLTLSIFVTVALGAFVAPALAAGDSQGGMTHSTSLWPFTGIDFVLIAAAATVLLVLGIVMARLTRSDARSE